jgi:tRNA A-37 threonylcarbamoyl transferase component Bud32/DNA-binding MarR family transcriptional regulator
VTQRSKLSNPDLTQQIIGFCHHIAGGSKIVAVCMYEGAALAHAKTEATAEIVAVISNFQPRLMGYVKAFNSKVAVVLAVDQWVFERDIDRGFLGEALVAGLIFPNLVLVNGDYFHVQEVRLKKRLTREMLESLVLSYPEFSYEFFIKPEYFLYEALTERAQLFPPMMHDLLALMRSNTREQFLSQSLRGYVEALKQLESEGVITFSDGYVRLRHRFVDEAAKQRLLFTNLLKGSHRRLFMSLLGVLVRLSDLMPRNMEFLRSIQKGFGGSKATESVVIAEDCLYIPTASGIVPFNSRLSIEQFAKKVLGADKDLNVKTVRIGGILNDVYLVKFSSAGVEKTVIAKRFRDWSNFKWFPLTLWTVGTRRFSVSGRSRLEKECAMNQLLYSKGFCVPKLLHVNPSERLTLTECIDGESLDKIVRKIGSSKIADEVAKGLGLLTKVGETFAKVHALDVSLGDTKPENILVTRREEVCLLDFEQASRRGDKVWDVAEFLYYAGHYVSPLAEAAKAESIAEAFIRGYVHAGGSLGVIKKAANAKYTKVFSVFIFPHHMLAIANVCRRVDKGVV